MHTIQVFQRLDQHRAWVNANLLTAAESLNEEQLLRPFEIGQGSIWKSLLHLYAAESVWLEALLGNESAVTQGDAPGQRPGNQQGENRITGLPDLRQKWSVLGQRWVDYLATLKPESLDEVVFKVSYLGQRFGSRRSDVLLHVSTHSHYTTAQVMNMLRHVGVAKLPDVMLIALAR